MNDTITREVCLCKRCGWRWISRLSESPIRCARCRSLKWQEERRPRAQIPAVKTGGAGQPRKYPIGDLAVGAKVLLPWPKFPDGRLDAKTTASMNRSIDQEQRRYGKKFHRQGFGRGLEVTRIA